MLTAIGNLMAEHRQIESVLNALERLINSSERHGQSITPAQIRDFADFFNEFVDHCHHGKEEELLFSAMLKFGFSSESDPMQCLLAEHTEGRQIVRVLLQIGSAEGPIDTDTQRQFIAYARNYIDLLRSHILKEDRILLPMAIQALPPDVMQAVGDACTDFDAHHIGAAALSGWRDLARRLTQI
ncbi:MAG: hypothetical protein A2V90_03870 [Gammaproteobacteria bacterium RBG_16_57_12]|nr:MAG: hypothetical protein A2V90_03870 [Gammaproteobacteria bacterium RBG_16_57_12]